MNKTKTKYNQTFVIIEIIDEALGGRTFIGYHIFLIHFIVYAQKIFTLVQGDSTKNGLVNYYSWYSLVSPSKLLSGL